MNVRKNRRTERMREVDKRKKLVVALTAGGTTIFAGNERSRPGRQGPLDVPAIFLPLMTHFLSVYLWAIIYYFMLCSYMTNRWLSGYNNSLVETMQRRVEMGWDKSRTGQEASSKLIYGARANPCSMQLISESESYWHRPPTYAILSQTKIVLRCGQYARFKPCCRSLTAWSPISLIYCCHIFPSHIRHNPQS